MLIKPFFSVSNIVRHNWAVQPQKMARGLDFRDQEEDGYIYIVKTKALISCTFTTQLICIFVFAYAKRFFHQVAYMCFLAMMCEIGFYIGVYS